MSWVRAQGQDDREFYVRASDIAEIELAADGRGLFRRRGHPHQYVAKEPTEVAKLEEILTTDEPVIQAAPPPMQGPVQLRLPLPKRARSRKAREPRAPKPPQAPTAVQRALELLEAGQQWRPQLRQSLFAMGFLQGAIRGALCVLTRHSFATEVDDLMTITTVGLAQLQIFRGGGKLPTV